MTGQVEAESSTGRSVGREKYKPRKARPTPRVSLNPLAEYMTAGPGRRRTILTEQKWPEGFQTAYYREAEHAIARCLASGGKDRKPIAAALRELEKPGETGHEVVRRETGRAALKAFEAWLGKASNLETLRAAPEQPEHLHIGPVDISVRPELHVVAPDGAVVGALKLYLKRKPLKNDRARYAAAIVHEYVERILKAGKRTEWKRCMVLDVLAGKLYDATEKHSSRRRQLAAACGEIGAVWPSLERP
jgi:hypothetical protein